MSGRGRHGGGRGFGLRRGFFSRGRGVTQPLPPNVEPTPQQAPAGTPVAARVAVVDEEACIGCGACVNVCPLHIIKMDKVAKIDTARCTGCAICTTGCPVNAISMQPAS